MADVSGVKTSLVQSTAVERVAEAARRQGESEQRAFATTLNRQVDAREHRVNEGEKPVEDELDPEGRRTGEESKDGSRERTEKKKEELPKPDEDGPGRLIDVRA